MSGDDRETLAELRAERAVLLEAFDAEGLLEGGNGGCARAWDVEAFEESREGGTKIEALVQEHLRLNDLLFVAWLVERYPEKLSFQAPVDGYGNTLLHHAAQKANVEALGWLLERHGSDVDVCALNDDHSSVLRAAVCGGSAQCVEMLLNAGADPLVASESGNTPLHQAVDRGHSRIVRLLLLAGADHSQMDRYSVTPLMVALRKWQEADIAAANHAIDMMIACGGVDWSQTDNTGTQLVHFACKHGKLSLLGPVFSSHPELVHTVNARQETLLHAAVENTKNGPHLGMLLDAGLPVDAVDEAGNTVLHHLFPPTSTVDTRVARLLGILCDGHADAVRSIVNTRNAEGVTPLWMAINNKHVPDAIQLLVDMGADVMATALPGGGGKKKGGKAKTPTLAPGLPRTPLTMAIHNAHIHVAIVEVLASSRGLDINAVVGPRTLLHHAVRSSASVEKVQALLDAGADPTLADASGKLPIDVARKVGVVQLLRRHGGDHPERGVKRNAPATDAPAPATPAPATPAIATTTTSTTTSSSTTTASAAAASTAATGATEQAPKRKAAIPWKKRKLLNFMGGE